MIKKTILKKIIKKLMHQSLTIKIIGIFLIIIFVVVITYFSSSYVRESIDSTYRWWKAVFNNKERCFVGLNKTFGNYKFTNGYMTYKLDSIETEFDEKDESINSLFRFFTKKSGCTSLSDDIKNFGDDIISIPRIKNNFGIFCPDLYVLGRRFPYCGVTLDPVEEKNSFDKDYFYILFENHIEIKMDRETRKFVEVYPVFDSVVKDILFKNGNTLYIKPDSYVNKKYNLGLCSTCVFSDNYFKVADRADDFGYIMEYKGKHIIYINDIIYNYNGVNKPTEISFWKSARYDKSKAKFENTRLGNFQFKDGFLYYQRNPDEPLSQGDIIIYKGLPWRPANYVDLDDSNVHLISNNILKIVGMSEQGDVYLLGNYLYIDQFSGRNAQNIKINPVELMSDSSYLSILMTPDLEFEINLFTHKLETTRIHNAQKSYNTDELYLKNNKLYLKIDINQKIPNGAEYLPGFIVLGNDIDDFSVDQKTLLIEINNKLYSYGEYCIMDICYGYGLIEKTLTK